MLVVKDSLKKNDFFGISKDWPQILPILSASFLSFSAGSLFAFTSPAIPKLLTDEYNFTIDQASYLTVIPPIFNVLSTPVFCKLADGIGRKYTLLSGGILHIMSWILTAFAKNIYVFYLARTFYGMSDASLFAAMPVYIAEVTSPRVRTLYGNIMIVSMFMGQFVANSIGYYCTIQTGSLTLLSLPVIFVISFIFMPESPYYLIMTGKEDDAKKSLQKLRKYNDITSEFKQMNYDVHRQLSESGNFKDLWLIKSNRKALIIANVSRIFQQLSGFGFIVVYAQYIFEQMGGNIAGGISAIILSGTVAVINIFANIISDKLGRRKSMIISSIGCGVVLLAEAIYFYLQTYEVADLSALSWFPVAGIIVHAMMFCVGLGIVPTLMLGEIFSVSVRKYATAVTNMVFGICVCTILKLFQVIMGSYGMWVPFLIFGSSCLCSSIIYYFIIPETKGKTLEEIQQMLKGNSKAQKTDT